MSETTALKVAVPDEGSPICITEGCGKERKWKGLCSSCYGQARKLIEKKQVADWDELEAMGLIIADDKPFVAAFKRKLKEAEESRSPKPVEPSE
jgi:hypothetical protein